MISPTSSPGLFGAPPTTTNASRTSMGKDEFLRLLVTQLQNQDPLSPLQPHEFAAQLAQFSSVEQLTQLNDGMAAQSQLVQLTAMMGQTNFGASLIGHEVLAEGNQVTIPASGSAQIRVDVGAPGGSATLRLLDAAGHEVAKRDMGRLSSGRQTLTLPADLPPGDYHYELTVAGSGDTTIPVTSYTSGVVDRLSFKDGHIYLHIGGVQVLLEDVAEVGSFTSSTTGNP
jgi:flagellar basal-body rod modification protein FlgD